MGECNRNEGWNKKDVQWAVLITQGRREEGLRKQVRKRRNGKTSNI